MHGMQVAQKPDHWITVACEELAIWLDNLSMISICLSSLSLVGRHTRLMYAKNPYNVCHVESLGAKRMRHTVDHFLYATFVMPPRSLSPSDSMSHGGMM
jgi:hypothetical protein